METLHTELALTDKKVPVQESVQASLLATLASYYEMTKPGITRMVVLSAAAGYYLETIELMRWPSMDQDFSRLIGKRLWQLCCKNQMER